MNAKLTLKQKRDLIRVARSAYQRLCDDSRDARASFDAWRHEQCRIAAGCEGFTSARQKHFCRLMARFCHLDGDDAAAMRWEERAATEEVRELRWLIQDTCRRAGHDISYAAAIAADQHGGRPWDSLDLAATRNLLATVKTRLRAKSLPLLPQPRQPSSPLAKPLAPVISFHPTSKP